MNQDNNQSTQQAGVMPEWFKDTAPNPEPPRKKRSPKIALIIASSIIVLGVCIVIGLSIATPKSTCLDITDYKELTGVTLSDSLSPTDNFYTQYAQFKDNSVSYDSSVDGGQHGDVLIQKIVDFYKGHPSKPMVITVGGSYLTPSAETLTNQRISTVESSLLKAGIPSAIIAVTGANYIAPEDEGSGDSGEVTLAVTSDPSCR